MQHISNGNIHISTRFYIIFELTAGEGTAIYEKLYGKHSLLRRNAGTGHALTPGRRDSIIKA